MRVHAFKPPQLVTPWVWTSSSLKLFRTCKRKFFWKYILRIRDKSTSPDLLIGTAFHTGLEKWYTGRRVSMKRIADKQAKWLLNQISKYIEFYNQKDVEKAETVCKTLAGMLMGYADVYGEDKALWIIDKKNVEVKFKVDLGDFEFWGKIDMHAVNRKKRYDGIFEHKTAVKIEDGYADRIPMDTQFRGYLFGAVHGLKLKPNRLILDAVKKCKLRQGKNETVKQFNERVRNAYMCEPEKYFYREALLFSKQDLDTFEYEMRVTHAEFMGLIKDRDPYDPRSWPPTDTACWDFFRTCEYFALCTVGLDLGTGMRFEQSKSLHTELQEELGAE